MRTAILLRGVSLGATNRVPMPALRTALAEAGFTEVRTYVQSGNIVATHDSASDEELQDRVGRLIEGHFDLSIPVVVRSLTEMRAVVDASPFPEIADEHPKAYQVSFLDAALDSEVVERLSQRRADGDAVAVSESGREIYAHHPGGIHRSKLASALTDRKLGVTATARNWTTVITLLEMLEDDGE